MMITANPVSDRASVSVSAASFTRRTRTEAGAAETKADEASAARIARGRALLADPTYPSPAIVQEVAKAWLASESANDNAPLWRAQG